MFGNKKEKTKFLAIYSGAEGFHIFPEFRKLRDDEILSKLKIVMQKIKDKQIDVQYNGQNEKGLFNWATVTEVSVFDE